MKKPRVSAIAAIAEKSRALGKDKRLLWSISEDQKRFRRITLNHPIIMGRGTFEHIMLTVGRAFKDRTNIVVSHDSKLEMPSGFNLVSSFEKAVEFAKKFPGGNEEAFIIGGGKLWTDQLSRIDRLYLTIIQDEKPADAFFPDYSEFKTVIDKSEVMEDGGIKYYYLTLER